MRACAVITLDQRIADEMAMGEAIDFAGADFRARREGFASVTPFAPSRELRSSTGGRGELALGSGRFDREPGERVEGTSRASLGLR